MEGAKEIQLIVQQGEETEQEKQSTLVVEGEERQSKEARIRSFKLWIRVILYAFLVLSGQSVATILGRLYYDNGGNSKWTATLFQLVGFPVLFPLYFFFTPKSAAKIANPPSAAANPPSDFAIPPSAATIWSVYASLGLLTAANCYLYSVGLLYLPVSTYSLICASQLAFNAFFARFLNAEKFTPFVVNSLVLLTVSSTLLVFSNESQNQAKVSKGQRVIGFVCTVGASAGYGLVLSLTQLTFQKLLKKQTFSEIMNMIIYPSFAASAVILVGLFASGEWKDITGEMKKFKLGGGLSYVMILVWTAISWQVFNIGSIGMILEVSSLFSNAISVLGLPIIPILAVVLFHDKMDGLKIISLLLAIWGFVSYGYQHYLDYQSLKKKENGDVKADFSAVQ